MGKVLASCIHAKGDIFVAKELQHLISRFLDVPVWVAMCSSRSSGALS